MKPENVEAMRRIVERIAEVQEAVRGIRAEGERLAPEDPLGWPGNAVVDTMEVLLLEVEKAALRLKEQVPD